MNNNNNNKKKKKTNKEIGADLQAKCFFFWRRLKNIYCTQLGRCSTREKSSLSFSACGTRSISKRLKTEMT